MPGVQAALLKDLPNHKLELDLEPPHYWDITDHPLFDPRRSYEYDIRYRCQNPSPPKHIDGCHWRLRRIIEKDRGASLLADGRPVCWTQNEFGEDMPVVPHQYDVAAPL